MSYTVKWLDDKEFEALPYPDMDVSLGIADPKKRTAYVRRTGIRNLDFFNTFHELEHLEDGQEGSHADHYENGVYYKKMNQVLDPIASIGSFIPGPWQAPAMAYSGYRGATKMFGGKQQQQQPQQVTMDQFNPGYSVNQNNAQPPATVQVGGGGGQSGGGGLAGGIVSKIRDLLRQRQSGFYSGRDPGGSM